MSTRYGYRDDDGNLRFTSGRFRGWGYGGPFRCAIFVTSPPGERYRQNLVVRDYNLTTATRKRLETGDPQREHA